MSASAPHPDLPPGTPVEPHPALDALIGVMHRLRAPGGCAWDAEQTHESLTKYLIEEAHELVDAIEHGSRDDMLEELGDVLYQVLFHADIAAADAEHPFTIDDVAARSMRKMVGRHPHVFADVVADTADEVSANWETWKAAEKPARTSVLDGLPAALPALVRAEKVLSRAERLGVEQRPLSTTDDTRGAEPTHVTADERALGEQLLHLVAVARERGWDAERALRMAVRDLETSIRDHERGRAER
ncbi:MazG family protein [Microcella alkalica]|uniref:MazG family protein n=1 Tax=Microcella alkalica TaxID=355930 RepID=UPI00145CBCC6|nr:MazG family protein [Microcella alkalica]